VNPPSRTFPWTTGVGLLLLMMCLALALAVAGYHSRKARGQDLPVYGRVADFTLTNQDGRVVSLNDLRGHPWLADIIFTRCAGPCLRMSRQMEEVQSALPPSSGVRLVSLTTDPDFDSPPVLTKYGERFGADKNRWMFLTGSKSQIGNLATGSLKLSAVEKAPAAQASPGDLFVHSTIFVAVDKQGQLRGIFQTGGDGVNWAAEKHRILSTLAQLDRAR
jgi:protein SCO1